MDDHDIVRADFTEEDLVAMRPMQPGRIVRRETETPLDLAFKRLDALDARLNAIDDLLRSITETMLTLGRADAAIYDTVKTLAKRVDAGMDLAELRTLIP